MSQLHWVIDHLAFGHLEDDAPNRKVISGRGFKDAGDRVLRRLQALREKIEIQPARYAQSYRLRDGDDARAPVEVVKIGFPYLLQYCGGRFTTGAANQCFIGIDLTIDGVDNWLKRKREAVACRRCRHAHG
jgi:hypothetical protein